MSTFRCGRFPTGTAHVRTAAGVVDFIDGRAEVDDPDVATALREVLPVFQITEDEPKGDATRATGGRGGGESSGGTVAVGKPTRRPTKRAKPPAKS